MEFEQIIKRLDFLEKQQRANKDTLAALSERINSFETSVGAASKQIKTVAKQVSDMLPGAKRVEQFEALLTKQRNDMLKMIEENEKNRIRSERDFAKHPEVADLQKTVLQFKTVTTTGLAEFKKAIKEQGNDMQRMANNAEDFKVQINQAVRSNEDVLSSLKAMDETRKNDLKRIADIQGEITAIRKRVDENRDKYAITTDGIRNVENRFADLLASEQERKHAQNAFLEQQAIAQIDRDRAWKDWKEKFDSFQKEVSSLDVYVQNLDEALRGARKAQDTYLELNTKLERRISEVTEMQRLAEDRLRQEWVTFKTDDQKRWTGYNLSSEESFREIRKDVQKTEEHITSLSDVSQILQDQMHQTTDTTEKELQELMNVVHDWMTSYQRIMGHGKKTTKK